MVDQIVADVLLVTVNEYETDAVIKACKSINGFDPKIVPIDDRVYLDLGIINGASIFHALSEMGNDTLGGSQQTVDKAIRALNPSVVIAVGIAFGVDEKKQKIGEILLSTQLFLYELQRHGKKIVLRNDKPHASLRLINMFKNVFRTTWNIKRVWDGGILSGAKLVDDIDYRNQLIDFFPEAIGGEMEGAGVYVSSTDHKVDWIVIKAISDWGDGNKAKNKASRQKKASQFAANFVLHTLKEIPVGSDKRSEANKSVLNSVKEIAQTDIHNSVVIGGNVANSTITISRAENTNLLLKQVPAIPPREIGFFVGRKEILSEIKSRIIEHPRNCIIAITGMGGSGKTSTALEIAQSISGEFGNNIFWNSLDGSLDGDATSILKTWITYCGYEIPRGIEENKLPGFVRGLLLERQELTNTNLVFFIDDIRPEWLDAGVALLSAIPANMPIVITTREKDVARSLHAKEINLDKYPFSDFEVYDFLAKKSDNKINQAQSKIIGELCERMPLALELAAPLLEDLGADELIDKLTNENKLMETLKRTDSPRKEQSVKATFQVSYDSLQKNNHHSATLIFRALSVFSPNAISAKHLFCVIPEAADNTGIENELLLLDKYSLLQEVNDGNEEKVYRMHALLHSFSNGLLEEKEIRDARLRHFYCFHNFIIRYANARLSDIDSLEDFNVYLPQLVKALDNFEILYNMNDSEINNTELKMAIKYIEVMDQYWTVHDRFDDQIRWFEFAYNISRKIRSRINTANFARRLGRIKGWKGEIEDGLNWMNKCSIALGNNKSKEANTIRAKMHIHRASLLYQKNQLNLAMKDCMRGLKLSSEKRLPEIYAEGYNILGAINLRKNRLPQALEAFKKSVSIWKRINDQYQVSRVDDNIRSTVYYLGNIAELRKAEEEGLKYWSKFPDSKEYAAQLTNRGLVYYIDGENKEAIEFHTKALGLSEKLGYQRLIALAKTNLAWPYISLGRYSLAERLLKESLKLQRKIGNNEFELDTRRCLAEIEIGRGNFSRAIKIANSIAKIAKDDQNDLDEGAALRVLGQAYHLKRDFTKSAQCLEKSYSILIEDGYKHEALLTAKALTDLYYDTRNNKKTLLYSEIIRTLSSETGIKIHKSYKIESRI